MYIFKVLLHPNCSILIGDFNAKSSKLCSSDKDNKAGCELDNITTSAGYSQMIDKPTHFINESSSYIDLIFSSNLVFSGLNMKVSLTDLGVRWNLHSEIGLNEKKDKIFT